MEITDSLRDLALRLDRFAQERDWQRFHSPKNLASALVVESGELLEHFQWMTEEQSRSLAPGKRSAVADEVADVLAVSDPALERSRHRPHRGGAGQAEAQRIEVSGRSRPWQQQEVRRTLRERIVIGYQNSFIRPA